MRPLELHEPNCRRSPRPSTIKLLGTHSTSTRDAPSAPSRESSVACRLRLINEGGKRSVAGRRVLTGLAPARRMSSEDAGDDLATIMRVELCEKLLDMVAGRVNRHAHVGRKLLIAEALRQQQRSLALLRR